MRVKLIAVVAALVLAWPAVAMWVDEYKSGIVWPEPPVVDPGEAGKPPSDAIVLFDGKDLSQWESRKKGVVGPAGWKIENGYAQIGRAHV
mgnify:CR=1 FL=1